MTTRAATAADVDDIVALLQANETTRGGAITGHFDAAQIHAAIGDLPVIVARVDGRLAGQMDGRLAGQMDGRLAGVLIASSIDTVKHREVIARMLDAYPGDGTAYVYGPICVDAAFRARGVAASLVRRLQQELPDREGVLFIRRDNTASIAAHVRLGMQPRGDFTADGVACVVLSLKQ